MATGANPVTQAEVLPQPAATAETPELEYRYQATDADGHALGGVQVIKYRTAEELANKLRDQNIELTRLNRKLKWEHEQARPSGDVPADAERLPEPKPLAPSERLQLSKDLLDPAKMDQAFRRLQEAGEETPAAQHARVLREATEAQTWSNRQEDYYECPENNTRLVKWCRDRKLLITQANLDIAYKQLTEAGLLLEVPIPVEETRTNTQSEAEETASRIAQVETPPVKRPESTSSGLRRSQTSAGSGAPAKRGLTWADVDRMSSEEFERKIRNDSAFRRAVDNLPAR
jgi:hypothetical protein